MTSSTADKNSELHRQQAFGHCMRRLRERYGVTDAGEQNRVWIAHAFMLFQGKGVTMGRRKDLSDVVALEFEGRTWFIAWRPDWRLMLTYLTEEQAWNNVGRRAEYGLAIWKRRQTAISPVEA